MNKLKVEFKLDELNEIREPSFHDAEVDEFQLSGSLEDKTALVRMTHYDDQKFEIIIYGITDIILSDFRPQNVIYDAHLYESSVITNIPDYYYQEFKVEERNKSDFINKIKSKNLNIIEFSASVGLALLCVCRKIEIYAIHS